MFSLVQSSRVPARAGLCALLAFGLFSASCNLINRGDQALAPVEGQAANQAEEAVDESQLLALEVALEEFRSSLDTEINTASNAIRAKSEDPVANREALEWKMNTIRAADTAREQSENPPQELLNVWSYTASLDHSLSSGTQAAFGQQHPEARQAAKQLHERISAIAKEFLPPENFEALRAQIAEDAAATAQEPEAERSYTPFHLRQRGRAAFNTMLNTPLGAPLRVAEGAAESAEAAASMPQKVDKAIEVVRNMPRESRFQAELLALSLNENPAVQRSLGVAEQIGNDVTSITLTVDRLPEEVRQTVKMTLNEAEALAPELQATLAEARATLHSLESALGQADVLTAQVGTTTDKATSLMQATEQTVIEVGKILQPSEAEEEKPAADAPPPRPFDITEYTTAIQELGATLEELEQVLEEAQDLLGHDGLPRQVDAITEDIGDVITKAVIRIAMLILFFFVLLTLYKVLLERVIKRKTRVVEHRG